MANKKRGFAEFNLFDAYGNQEFHTFYRTPKKSKLGGGWVAFYKRPIRKLLEQAPNFSTFKVYMYLASKQTYQKCVMVTPTAIMQGLKMSSSTVAVSLKWLKEHDYIQMYTIDGNTGWLLNPKVTVCGGTSKRSKQELWDAGKKRQIAELDKTIANREELLKHLDNLINSLIVEENEDVDEITSMDVEDNRFSAVGGVPIE